MPLPMTVFTQTQKQTFCRKDVPVLSVKLSYPYFEEADGLSSASVLSERLNRFYTSCAKHYLHQASTSFLKKAERLALANKKPVGLVLNAVLSYASDTFLSVYTDIGLFDGKKVKTYRYAQNWSVDKAAILPVSRVFDTAKPYKNEVIRLLVKQASERLASGKGTFFDNYAALIARYFDWHNAYFTDRGIAFFYDQNRLSNDTPVTVFVLSATSLEKMAKFAL